LKILYLSYDGMLEPLGQSQVLAYLEHLAGEHDVHLISFEKAEDWASVPDREAVRARIAAAGIIWRPLRYHKRPSAPATAYDIMVGTLVALYLTLRHRIQILHARSYVAAAMAMMVKKVRGTKLLFDMRGLWADERVDAGIWPRGGRLYRMAKWLEKSFLLGADHVVTLTQASAAEIGGFDYLADRAPPISVIPTCADLQRFSRAGPPSEGPFVLGFVGAAGTWALFDEMLVCFQILRELEPDARLLIVNRNEHNFIRDRLGKVRIDPDSVELVAARHHEVAALISRMSAGTAIRKPAYSQIACAPTKLAEYLGCGVPCLSNRGIGDVEAMLEESHVGVVLRDFSDAEMRLAVARLVALAREEGIRERCAAAARRFFSLENGVAAYGSVYRRLGAGRA